jgi:hypothetical protein
MIARGKREARRPWFKYHKACEGLKDRNTHHVLRPFQGSAEFLFFYQGRRASLRSRLPLAIIFRAVGAVRSQIVERRLILFT